MVGALVAVSAAVWVGVGDAVVEGETVTVTVVVEVGVRVGAVVTVSVGDGVIHAVEHQQHALAARQLGVHVRQQLLVAAAESGSSQRVGDGSGQCGEGRRP